jgi:hypothetical protein
MPRASGTVGNERLTSATGAVLTALLVAEGVTILWLGGLRTEHMFIGLVLIPPVALKLASTGYRFARYYTGAPTYRAKGPPLLPLRLLAPVLVATTALVFGSGVALLLIGHRSDALLEPRAWRTLAAGRDTSRPERVPGSHLPWLLVSAALGSGLAIAVALLSLIEAWHGGPHG